MTCGEETEQLCLNSIAHFKDEIIFQEVRNVYPQIKALNEMLSKTKTDYLVPLDADFILSKDAHNRICEAIRINEGDNNWHSILFSLFDTFTEKKIFALKVLRMSIIKNFPFIESATPDVEHFGRLQENGYSAINYFDQEPIGTHNVVGPKFCYHKYKDVYRTLRIYQKCWDSNVFMGGETILEKSKNHFDFFQYKWIMTGNKDYLYAIAGMIEGLTSSLENKSKSLDEEMVVRFDLAIDSYMTWYYQQQEESIFL
jgi:hypothetical protein